MSRAARQLFAGRLRALRESTFATKLTQDQLASLLGANKPLSSAIISGWENGEIDKRPSVSRTEQYALIFSQPAGAHPGARAPRLEDLDLRGREAYVQLRDDLLEMRRDAEREAWLERRGPSRRGSSELWHHKRSDKLIVVCSELPPEHLPPFANTTNANYIRLSRYADTDAFFLMYTTLTALGYENLSHRSGNESAIDFKQSLIIIGGVAWNRVTRVMMELLDLPYKQQRKPEGDADIFTMPDGDVAEPVVIEGAPGEEVPEVVQDIGLFVRTKNPTNPERDVTLCSGVFTHGVLGAVMAFTDADVAEENETTIRQKLGEVDNFAALFSVKIVAGRVAPPRFSDSLLGCAPL